MENQQWPQDWKSSVFILIPRKEIEENNRMGKTRDLFKKIRDANGTFHAKMGRKRAESVWI